MIAKVSVGARMSGLMMYLAGPGRSNEHTNQRVITGSETLIPYAEQASLGKGTVMQISRELDADMRRTETVMPKGHVFHASISLSADDKTLTDEQWASVAHDFMKAMEFTESGGRSPVAWIAINHGVNLKGNPHIHIAASMVREDGTKWNQHESGKRAVKICRELEEKYDLQRVGQDLSSVAYVRGEKESLARRQAMAEHRQLVKTGQEGTPWESLSPSEKNAAIAAKAAMTEQPRVVLARRIRGCAAASADEGEFVRRMRREGLLVRPRFAEGASTEVTGFSVADRPQFGERPIWYGGGKLGKDLTLPALRGQWDTPASAAVQEWTAAAKGKAPAMRGAEQAAPLAGEVMVSYANEVTELLGQLKDAGASAELFATVARQGAGIFAAWANQAGIDGDMAVKDLREASDAFAKSAQLRENPGNAVVGGSTASRALAGQLAIGMNNRAGAVAMVRMWTHMGKSLGQGLQSHGEGLRARAMIEETMGKLEAIHDAYRLINPVQVSGPGEGPATGTRATPSVEATVRKTVAETAADQSKKRSEELRAQGVPEEAITALVHAERQSTQQGNQPAQEPTTVPSTAPQRADDNQQNINPRRTR